MRPSGQHGGQLAGRDAGNLGRGSIVQDVARNRALEEAHGFLSPAR